MTEQELQAVKDMFQDYGITQHNLTATMCEKTVQELIREIERLESELEQYRAWEQYLLARLRKADEMVIEYFDSKREEEERK